MEDTSTRVIDTLIGTEAEDTSIRFDVIGPMDSDCDEARLEDKLRVELATGEELLSFSVFDVDWRCSIAEVELSDTGDGPLVVVDSTEDLVSFLQG